MDCDQMLRTITDKVHAGERLSFDEGVFLDEKVDVLTVGQLANVVRERKNGKYAYYNTNVHLNPTNVCVYRCTFCAFRADLKAAKAYEFTDEMIRDRVLEAKNAGATEIHVVGGLHHQKPFDWYLNVVRVIHETYPDMHIKAWTPVEIHWFSYITKRPVRWVLEQMIDAGLGSLPGGGAEIFHPGSPRSDLRAQGRRRPMVRHPPRGARPGPAFQRDHALRPHRESATPRRPPVPAPRTAGRDGRLSDVHPAGVSSGEHRALAHSEGERPGGSQDDRDGPADARQLRPHQGVLDHAGREDRPRLLSASGPTTSTARSCTS